MNVASMIPALEELISSLMRESVIPGLSVALVTDGTVVWNRGFGVKQVATPMLVDTDTVFEAASLSKPLFAYGVLQLHHDGVLDLDAPLTRYVPDRSFCADPRLDRVTARTVLSHTTGFPNWRRSGRSLRMDRLPGKRFGYSGEGYVYLQQIVEHLSDRPLDEYMHRAVLTPLGMTHSSYVWRESYEHEAAVGHTSGGLPYPKERSTTANAAMSLHTTPRDFARFLWPFLDAKSRQTGLSELDINGMLTSQVPVAGNLSWGLGWGLQHLADEELFWHWGDNPGFKNFVAVQRRRRSGVIIMSSSDNGIRAWGPIAQRALGMDTEIFDWLATTFYGKESAAQL